MQPGVDAANYGIKILSPKFFSKEPDFVDSGPNIGNTLGLGAHGSGTVGAACKAWRSVHRVLRRYRCPSLLYDTPKRSDRAVF